MRHAFALAVVALAAPFTAAADGLSYNYIQAAYLNADADAVSNDARGYQLHGSYGFLNNFFVTGKAGQAESEDFTVGTASGKLKFTEAELGLGAHLPLAANLDAVASVNYLYFKVEGEDGFEGNESDDSGVRANIGIRAQILPSLEINGTYRYTKVDEDDGSEFVLGSQYRFTPMFSAIVELTRGSEADGYLAGARINF